MQSLTEIRREVAASQVRAAQRRQVEDDRASRRHGLIVTAIAAEIILALVLAAWIVLS
jgi:hypothetical protein